MNSEEGNKPYLQPTKKKKVTQKQTKTQDRGAGTKTTRPSHKQQRERQEEDSEDKPKEDVHNDDASDKPLEKGDSHTGFKDRIKLWDKDPKREEGDKCSADRKLYNYTSRAKEDFRDPKDNTEEAEARGSIKSGDRAAGAKATGPNLHWPSNKYRKDKHKDNSEEESEEDGNTGGGGRKRPRPETKEDRPTPAPPPKKRLSGLRMGTKGGRRLESQQAEARRN